jgi:hypothetical protein
LCVRFAVHEPHVLKRRRSSPHRIDPALRLAPPGMVDIRVRKDDGVDVADVPGGVFVLLLNVRVFTLEESAIQENGVAVDAHDVA